MQAPSFLSIQLLEEYVLSQDKKAFLQQLAKSSQQSQYLEILHRINNGERLEKSQVEVSNLPEEVKVSLKIKQCLQTLSADNSKLDLIGELNSLLLKYDFNDQQLQPFQKQNSKPLFCFGKQPVPEVQKNLTFSSLEELFEIFYKNQTLENLQLISSTYLRKIDCKRITWTTDILEYFLIHNYYIKESDSFFVILKEKLLERDSMIVHLKDHLLKFFNKIPLALHINLVEGTFCLENDVLFNHLFNRKYPQEVPQNLELLEFERQFQERIAFVNRLRRTPSLLLSKLQYILLIKKYNHKKIDEDLFVKVLNLFTALKEGETHNHQEFLKVLFFYLRKSPESSIQIYDSFFHQRDLLFLQLKAKMFNNIDVDISSISPSDINEIVNKKILHIHSVSESQMQKEQKITVDIKAVRKLEVRIYQIDSQILKQTEDVDLNSIELAYQKPDFHFSFQFENPPNELHEEEFLIDQIPKEKKGIFLVTFLADYELESRCVLRKGVFKVFQDSITGHLCRIFDESDKLVEKASLDIDGQIFPHEEGVIKLSKEIVCQNKKVHVVFDNHYFPVILSLMKSDYYLDFHCIYNEESFQKKSKIQMNVFPVLQLNGKLIQVSKVSEMSIEITNEESGIIMDSQKFSNLGLKFKDFSVNYLVPENPNQIRIKLKVKLSNEGEDLEAEKMLHVKEMNQEDCFYCFYFSMDEEGNYLMKSVGCNGEEFPLSDLQVDYRYPFSTRQVSRTFDTNENGVLNLGKLENCYSILVKHKAYQKQMVLKQKTIRRFEFVKQQTVRVPGFENQEPVQIIPDVDFTMKLEDTQQAGSSRHYEVQGLPNKIHQIRYEDDSQNFILIKEVEQDKLNQKYFELSKTTSLNADEHIDYEVQEDGDKITVSLSQKDNLVPYLIRRNTLLESENDLAQTFMTRLMHSGAKMTMAEGFSIVNERKINEELNYIAERQQKGNFVQYNVPLPRNLLFREAISNIKIQSDQKVVKEETVLQQKNNQSKPVPNTPIEFYIKHQNDKNLTLKSFLLYDHRSNPEKLQIKEGKIVIQKSQFENHSFGYLLLCSGKAVKVLKIHSNEAKIKLKDNRYNKMTENHQIFKVNREVDIIDEKSISEVKADQEHHFIKSKKDFFLLIKKIIPSFKYDFLADWKNQSSKEKTQLLNEHFSLPLCLFIYFTDNSFHKKVVKPFLQNKFQKNVIEAFLTDDSEQLKSYCSLSSVSRLSLVENILLHTFCVQNEINFQHNLNEYLQSQKQNFKNEKMKKRYFDFLIGQNKSFDTAFLKKESYGSSVNLFQKQENNNIISQTGNQNPFGEPQQFTIPAPPPPPSPTPAPAPQTFGTQNIFQQQPTFSNIDNGQSRGLFGHLFPQLSQFIDQGLQLGTTPGFGNISFHQQSNSFGVALPPNNQPSSSIFERSSQNPHPQSSLFGSSSQQVQPPVSNSIFVQNANPNLGSFNFGSNVQTNSNQQQGGFGVSQANFFGNNSQQGSHPSPFIQALDYQINHGHNTSLGKPSKSVSNVNQSSLFGYVNQNQNNLFGQQAQKINLQNTVMYGEKPLQVESHNMINDFFMDFVNHVKATKSWLNFNSTNFIDSMIDQNQDEILLMLALMSLRTTESENSTQGITESPKKVILLKKQVILKEAQIQEESDIVVRQSIQKSFFMSNLKNQMAIRMKITVLNISEHPKKGKLLFEIPQGSIPLGSARYKNIRKLNLQSMQPVVYEISFYFPQEGSFKVSPAKFVSNQKIISQTQSETIEIQSRRKLKEEKEGDFGFFDQDLNEIKAKLFNDQYNPEDLNQEMQRKFFKDKEVYDKVISIQKKKGRFVESIWKFSVFHQDLDSFRELLNFHQNQFKPHLPFLKTPLLSFNFYESVEFYPLIKQRVFSTQNQNYLSPVIKQAYSDFLNYLIHKKEWSGFDKFHFIQFMLYFGKIQEAKEVFSTLTQAEKLKNELQSDYLTCYLEIMNPDNDNAVTLTRIEKYAKYPFKEWRKLFRELALVLKGNKDSKKLKQNKADEKKLEAQVKGNLIELQTENIEKIFVRYYEVDTETFFSLNPFKEIDTQKIKLTKSIYSEEIPITQPILKHQINDSLLEKDLVIYLESEGSNLTLIRGFCDFKTTIDEENGSIDVADLQSSPISQAYVKIFYLTKDQNILFMKDGFTDYKGGFDYSQNVENVENVERLSILIKTQKSGSEILSVKPWRKTKN